MSRREMGSRHATTGIHPQYIDQMKITLDAIQNESLSIRLPKHPRISDTVYHSCRKHCSGEVFFLYKTDWLRNSMLTDLLGDLVSIAVHGHTMLISITDICNNYMRNHPCSIHWDFYSDIWYFTKFKSEYL